MARFVLGPVQINSFEKISMQPSLYDRFCDANVPNLIAWSKQYISAMSCLIRTDYGFVLALFGYFLWVTRDEKPIHDMVRLIIPERPFNSLKFVKLIAANIFFAALDLIWLLSTGSLWGESNDENLAWKEMKGLHKLVIILSVVTLGIKVQNFMLHSDSYPPSPPMLLPLTCTLLSAGVS